MERKNNGQTRCCTAGNILKRDLNFLNKWRGKKKKAKLRLEEAKFTSIISADVIKKRVGKSVTRSQQERKCERKEKDR